MQKIILAGIIIAAVAGFIIWKPWKDLWNYLKQMHASGGSLSKNNIGQICRLSIFLLIPALLVGLIVLYCYFAGHHEHAFTETIVREATCKEEGVVRFQCRYCDYQYEKPLPLVAHKYEETNHTTSTCIEQGAIVSTCKTCGDVKTEAVPLIAHKYVETDRTVSTCEEQGTIVSTCKVCGDVKTEAIPLIAHKYEEVSRTDSTCSYQGTSISVCAMCKDTKMEAIPPAEHTYVEVERDAPSCLEAGRVIFRCQTCGGEKTESLPSGGEHQFKAFLLNAGDHTIVYVCSKCGTKKTESFSPEEEELIWSKFEAWHEREISEVWETEENGEPGTATPVANFSKVIANLRDNQDSDCFRFTVTKKSNVELDFSHDGDHIYTYYFYTYYWDATIYAADGMTVIKEGGILHNDKGEAATIQVPELEPGTYYIKISPAAGGNPFMNGFSDAFYYITFRSKCVSHDSVRQYLLKEPTCMEDGEYINVCSDCDEYMSTEAIKALSHKWCEWYTTRDAKTLSRGEKERTCSMCKTSEKDDFLHPSSIIVMIFAAVLMIVIIISLGKNDKLGWMAVFIVIGSVLCVFFYKRFFTKSVPETPNENVQQAHSDLTSVLKPVNIAWAEATSELNQNNPISNTFDGNLETCWQDGVDGNGEGEVLTYYFEQPCNIVGVDIINGRVINEENYYENNRIRSMTLYYLLNGEETDSWVLENMSDAYSREAVYYQRELGEKNKTYHCDGIKIVINSVYEGSVYDDLCLTEIKFYNEIYE